MTDNFLAGIDSSGLKKFKNSCLNLCHCNTSPTLLISVWDDNNGRLLR